MTDDRIDLSLLDPAADPDRIERIVGAVRARIAASEIAEPWVAPLARAWIPAFAAAALAGLLALAVPRSAERPAPAADSADPLAVSLGVPSQLARWATSEEFPSTAEVLTAIQPSSR